MSQSRLPGGEAAIDSLERAAASDLSAQELLEDFVERIGPVVPADGIFAASADPETSLCMGAGVVKDMPDEMCEPLWEHEFLVPDFNKFADLAAGPTPVADMHRATGGRPQLSPRWREFRTLTGFDAELRAAFTAGGRPWGYAQLSRLTDAPGFSDAELEWLERAAAVLGRGLRRALVSQASVRSDRGPGIVVFDENGRLQSASPEAELWMGEIEGDLTLPDRFGIVPVAAHLQAVAAQARADGDPGALPSTRARLRTREGTWILMHASFLRGADGSPEQMAIVIEPAKASDVAPLIVEAYELTAREVEVTRLIAQGLSTAEIAGQLFLSPHTVRDHVKAVFEKVGVSSRGELVAKMFADHYHDSVKDAIFASRGQSPAAAA